MKAIILKEAGTVENLQFAELEKPTLQDNEVLVKVISISINPVDVKARANEAILTWLFEKERPIILGWDISGEIVEIGKQVTEFKIGDPVFGMINFFGNGKAYSEYVVASTEHITLKPQNVSHQQAVASAMVGSTAYQALVNVAKIKQGDKVLIHGASGGVGHSAVQIAKHFGAYVIGTSSAKNKDFVLGLGADEHIDYTTENFWEKIRGVDIVLDTIAGDTLSRSVDVVHANGIIVTLPSHEIPEEVQENANKKQVKIEFMMVASKKETINSVAKLLENGVLKPHIHKSFPFAEMAKAHLEVETNRVVGKVVVNI